VRDGAVLISEPIETPRLLLRPETEADGEAIWRMSTAPDVMRFVGDGRGMTCSLEQFLARHQHNLAKTADDGYGNASVVFRETKDYLGWCGLNDEPRIGGVQLGFRFASHAWNRGYATEAARAVLTIGFDSLDLKEILAAAFPDNVRSIRVLQKIGMRPIRRALHGKAGRVFDVYSIRRGAAAAAP